MPIHQYRCRECEGVTELTIPIVHPVPSNVQCSVCRSTNTFKIFTQVNISKGVRSRVYYQWKGDPSECPPHIRDALKAQTELPQGVSPFHKEGEPVLGTGSKFKGD